MTNYSTVLSETVSIREEIKIYIKNPFNPENLKQLSALGEKRWVNWRYKIGDRDDELKKDTKVPYSTTGWKTDVTNPKNWSTLEEVLSVNDRFDGIGIAFDDRLLGIDIDHCLKNGIITHEKKEKIEAFLAKLNSYVETSPSNEGLHGFLSLTAPLDLTGRHRHEPFELYADKRFFTVTSSSYGELKPVRAVTPEEALSILAIIDFP